MIVEQVINQARLKRAKQTLEDLDLYIGKITPIGTCLGVYFSENNVPFIIFFRTGAVHEYSVNAVKRNLLEGKNDSSL